MKSFTSFVSSFVHGVLLGAIILFIATPHLPAQNADEIIAKINEAAGGVAKQKAIKTTITEMEMIFQGGAMKIPVKAVQKRPALMYTEASFQGMTFKTGYNGKEGWQINPFQGQTKPAAMNEEELKEQEEQADMDGEFIDTKEKGYTIELMGKEDLDGSMAYKFKVVNKHGDIKYRFFDADNYLPIKTVAKKKTKEGGEFESETYFSDFKKFGGLTIPCTTETKVKGQTVSQGIIKNIEFDKAIDDKIFAAPADAPTTEAKTGQK